MTEFLTFGGCTPEPLMGYLKALGAFRLFAQQADPTVRLSWAGGVCRWQTNYDRAAVLEFFAERYRPTPIMAPWNGGSGFYSGGREPVDVIAGSTSVRFQAFREAIESIRRLVPSSKPTDDAKLGLLLKCRNELPDEVVDWLDVSFVLGDDSVLYFPLLGTGGNDGRLDFTNNFLQRLADVLPLEAGRPACGESREWLAAALFGDTIVPLTKAAVGQFNPGGIGGANGVQGSFEAGSRVNPWDYVFMLEGALLCAGGPSRRQGVQSQRYDGAGLTRAAFPFTVDSVGSGGDSLSEAEETSDGSRGEFWLPLWSGAASLAEVQQLFEQGRAELSRRPARNAVEFSLAVSQLGVARGIDSFSRFGFLKRNGLAFLATPLGRVPVRARSHARLLDDPRLTGWVDSLRRACSDKGKTPVRYRQALRGVDAAMFDFGQRSEQGRESDSLALHKVLAALGRAERTLAGGMAFCKEKRLRPLADLSVNWLGLADEPDTATPELRLAASLSGVEARGDLGPFRVHLEPIEVKRGAVSWKADSSSTVWSNRPLIANLAAAFARRQVEAFRSGERETPLVSNRFAPLADVVEFLFNDRSFDERLDSLLFAFAAVQRRALRSGQPGRPALAARPFRTRRSDDEWFDQTPFEFGVLRLLVQSLKLRYLNGRWRIGDGENATVPDPEVFIELASGRSNAVGRAVDLATKRLRSSGFIVWGGRSRGLAAQRLRLISTIAPERLLASMSFPLSASDLARIADAVLSPPKSEK